MNVSCPSIERVRTYWDTRPCNIRHSPRQVGTREYFAEVEARKYFVEPHIPRFAQFDRWSGKHVLEVECGIGTNTINFARNGARVSPTRFCRFTNSSPLGCNGALCASLQGT